MSLHMPRLITWQYSSAREELEHALADVRRGIGYAHTRRLERGDLVLRAALAARDDRARMAHAFAGRRGDAGDIGHQRFAHAGLDVFRGLFLGRAADLADHDDALGLAILLDEFYTIDEIRALNRVAADADAGALAKAVLRRLMHGFVGERAGARDDADAPLFVFRARRDARVRCLQYRIGRVRGGHVDHGRVGLRRHHHDAHKDKHEPNKKRQPALA